MTTKVMYYMGLKFTFSVSSSLVNTNNQFWHGYCANALRMRDLLYRTSNKNLQESLHFSTIIAENADRGIYLTARTANSLRATSGSNRR